MSDKLSVWKVERISGVQPDYDRDTFADIHYFDEHVTAEHVKATLIEEGYIGDQDEVYCDSVEEPDMVPSF